MKSKKVQELKMKLKKRRKSARMRGSRTHGWAMKKHKGKGNVGGKGRAGSGKRASQKKTQILNLKEKYFGKKGMKAKRKIIKIINVGDIENNIDKMIAKGKAKRAGDGIEINLPDYKILGDGELSLKLIVHAHAVSSSAKEKIERRGGSVILE
ncbi:uL15 family ribosomal protein [Candidatus Pacearchaeota archaeon]|nr:uL15 family ribosomal protein [Candidatus Pacearchaeota archaeon]